MQFLDNNLPLKATEICGSRDEKAKKSDQIRKVELANVSTCLTQHTKCSGSYTDLAERYKISCDCLCHQNQRRNDA
jgi:hypothetical protein